jgi:hypothetical protein
MTNSDSKIAPLGEHSTQSTVALWVARAVAVLAVLVATGLIASTYGVFSQVTDEGAHIAGGMEWIDRGTYQYDTLHPPLARVASALGPYLAGLRSHGETVMWAEGNAILHSRDQYQRNLTLARLGILPFFWLCCGLVWQLTNKFMGAAWAAVSVFLFTTIPAVLAHSALATTDTPGTAMFFLAVVAWLRWRAETSWKQSIALGIAVGLALLTKISVLPFLVVTLTALLISDWMRSKKLGLRGRAVAVVCVVTLITIWAGYRFSFGPILRPGLQLHQLNRIVGDTGQLHDTTYLYLSEKIKVPAHEFLMGMVDVASMNSHGTRTYFLGRVSEKGRWPYFPVLLATKLPIVILLLAAAGIASAIGRSKGPPQEFIRIVLIGITAPLLVASFSAINLGLRHVLVIMPFVAMLAGVGVLKIWNTLDRPALRWVVAGVLLTANAGSCWSAAPDFLSYFNEPSRKYAANIVVDSDLDWGQDLNRLCGVLARYPAGARVFIAYQGTADLARFALPAWQRLPRGVESKGVVAISVFLLKTYPEDFGWLEKYRPAQRVGYSMLIYDLR